MNTKKQTESETLKTQRHALMEGLGNRDHRIEELNQREKILLDLLKASLKQELIAHEALEETKNCVGEWFQGEKYVGKDFHNNGDAFASDIECIVYSALDKVGKF